MPFGLTNAPAAFQRLLQDVLREELDVSVIVYIDDILIYSDDLAEHEGHVKTVLRKLRENSLNAKVTKCDFGVFKAEYLGLLVTPGGISMDSKKVDAVIAWAPPTNVQGTQQFLGFANFYRQFILGYSMIAAPIYECLKKERPWSWEDPQQLAFKGLKKQFTEAPILAHFDGQRETIVKTDASDYGVGAVLLQRDRKSVV